MHGDLRPDNICCSAEGEDLCLIDFSKAIRYLNEWGHHYERKSVGRFVGNFIYSSVNTCHLFNKSRNDDLEAVFYILLFLL